MILKEKNKFERKSIYHDQNAGKIKWSKTTASQTHSAVKRGVHLIGGFQESLCRNSGKFSANVHDIFTKSHPFRCIVKNFSQNNVYSFSFFPFKKYKDCLLTMHAAYTYMYIRGFKSLKKQVGIKTLFVK